jgi:hypothetical protein
MFRIADPRPHIAIYACVFPPVWVGAYRGMGAGVGVPATLSPPSATLSRSSATIDHPATLGRPSAVTPAATYHQHRPAGQCITSDTASGQALGHRTVHDAQPPGTRPHIPPVQRTGTGHSGNATARALSRSPLHGLRRRPAGDPVGSHYSASTDILVGAFYVWLLTVTVTLQQPSVTLSQHILSHQIQNYF